MKKKVVLRTCALTHEKLEKRDLIKVVRTKSGEVFIDDEHKISGRGCYLKKDIDVINRAKKSKILERNLCVQVNEELYEELLKKL